MESERHDLIYDENGNKRKYKPTIGRNNVVDYIFGSVSATDEGAIAQSKVDALDKGIENAQRQMDEAVKEASGLQFSVHGSNTRSDGGTGGKTGHGKRGHESKKELSLIENPATYKELANNVSYYQQQLEKANIADTENIMALARKKTAAESAAQAFKTMTEAAAVPGDLKSIDDYEKKLSYLRTSRNVANRDNIAAIDAEIERTEAAKAALEDESIAALKDDEIRTYDQLNKKQQYYNRLIQQGDEQQRIAAQKGINRLNKMQEAWDGVLAKTKLPDTTDNLGDIDEAISFYTQRQQHEDADQIQKTQVLIEELQRKKKAMQRGVELPSMLREADEIDALTGRERTVKIKGMGFDELTEKIRELQKMLNDVENPVTDSQRKQIEGLISTYSQWRSEMAVSFDTMKSGWDSIKGIGDSISSITSALEGNGNAWQTVTGIVDGFIQLYEGIQTIVGIIDMLTAANTLMAASETQKAAASTAAVTAQGTEAAAAVGNATAAAAEIAANKAATASFMELASAMFFAAHAYIPFVGAGIAAGMIASAVATVIGVGATPFAEGGVVSGPTMALIGEYAGASSNPEVVAPLDKLRSMLQPAAGTGGTVHFEIEGRKLVGVIANETRVASRSGRRTNIVV